MLPMLLSIAVSTARPAAADALNQCRSAIAAKLQGDASAVDVSRNTENGRWRTLLGNVTVLVGMGDPGPKRAKAHHLIRQRYDYRCALRGNEVRELSLTRSA